jgi:hypothetical protein
VSIGVIVFSFGAILFTFPQYFIGAYNAAPKSGIASQSSTNKAHTEFCSNQKLNATECSGKQSPNEDEIGLSHYLYVFLAVGRRKQVDIFDRGFC